MCIRVLVGNLGQNTYDPSNTVVVVSVSGLEKEPNCLRSSFEVCSR